MYSVPGVLGETPNPGTTICCRLGIVMNSHPTDGAIFVFPVSSARLAGTTAARPTTHRAGEYYFDTSLGVPIWWSGSAWVNSSGVAV